MKKIAMVFALVLGGCQNYYETYYEQSKFYNKDNMIFYAEEPKIIYSTSPEEDYNQYARKGYGVIGISHFNSGEVNQSSQSNLRKAAKKIGAEIVIWNKTYTNTVTGTATHTYYTPKTQTSYHSGTIQNNYKPLSSYNYTGTTRTYSQEKKVAYVPYSISRYDYGVIYLGKVINLRFGLMARNLLTEERKKNHLKSGIYITVIAENGPAFDSDLVEGDIVTKIDGRLIKNYEEFLLIDVSKLKKVTIEYLRDGKKKVTTIKFNHLQEDNSKRRM